jgi:hypothetical protein
MRYQNFNIFSDLQLFRRAWLRAWGSPCMRAPDVWLMFPNPRISPDFHALVSFNLAFGFSFAK